MLPSYTPADTSPHCLRHYPLMPVGSAHAGYIARTLIYEGITYAPQNYYKMNKIIFTEILPLHLVK